MIIGLAALSALPAAKAADVYWRSEAWDGNWDSGQGCGDNGTPASPWWYNGWDPNNARGRPDCYGNHIVHFNNNNQVSMTLNVSWYAMNQILFEGTTGSRTMDGSNGIDFYDAGAKIENNVSADQTFSVPVSFHAASEINPVSGGLTFNSIIYNNGNWINVWGNNDKTLSMGGVLDQGGGLAVKQNSMVILSNNNTFSGGLWVEKGRVRLQGQTNSLGAGTVSVGTNATLEINANITYGPSAINLYGTGTNAWAGAINSLAGGTLPNSITLYQDSRIRADGTAALTLRGSISAGSYTLYVTNTARAVNMTAGDLSGTKTTGDGALHKSGTNSFLLRPGTLSGNIVVAGGTLQQGTGTLPGGGIIDMANDTVWSSDGTSARTVSKPMTINGYVTLGHSTANRGALTLSNFVNLANGMRTLSVPNTNTISGVVTNGGLLKDGPGKLILGGANTYAGGTIISNGTLEGTTTSLQGNITNKAALIFNQSGAGTYAGVISDTGTMDKQGAGAVTLTGANTFSGAMTITAGEVQIGNNGVVGSVATASIVNNSALTFYRSDAVTYSGVISGTGTLTNKGAGPLTLSGNNTYLGATRVLAGTVKISHTNALGDVSSGTTVDSGTALEIAGTLITAAEPLTLSGTGISGGGALRNTANNNTFSGPITLGALTRINSDGGTLTLNNATAMDEAYGLIFGGSGDIAVSTPINTGAGTITKDGLGRLTLSGNSGYTGATAIDAGAIRVAHQYGLGWLATGTTVSNNAALEVIGGITLSEPLTLNGGGISSGGALRNISGDNSLAGAITLATASRINSDSGTLSLGADADISGAGLGLTVGGAGTVEIFGDLPTGAATLTKDGAGTNKLNNYSGSAVRTWTGATTISAGTMELTAANGISDASALIIAGGAAFNMVAGNDTVGSMAGAGSVVMGNSTLTAGGDGSSTTFSGAMSGAGGVLTKTGAGVLTLSGVNTHGGNTTVSAGSLIISGSAASSAFTVASGATLMGDGPIGTLAANGKVDPGNSATARASLSCGAVTLGAGGSMQVDISNVAGAEGTDWDLISSSGSITVNGSGTFTIYLNDAGSSGFDPATTYSWKIMDGTSGSGYDPARFAVNTDDFSPALDGGTFSVTESSGDLFLTFTAAAVLLPDILVRGTNMALIADGASTAQPSDGTDFGDVTSDGGTREHTFTVTNSGAAALNMEAVAIGGAQASDFTVSAPLGISVANLLQNSDLAQDGTPAQVGAATINNWTTWGASGWYNNDIDAQMAVKFWWNDSGMYQDFDCSAGMKYDFSVYARQRDIEPLTNWHGYLTAEFFDASWVSVGSRELDYISSDDPTNQWIQLSGSYTSPANSVHGRMVLGVNNWAAGPAGSAYFDNAAVHCMGLAAGSQTTFNVTFNPSADGARTATVYITNNVAGKTPYDFVIQGTGVAAGVWDGGGANGNWDTAENWIGDQVPGSGTNIVFYAGIASGPDIFLNGDRTVQGLRFNANADTALNIQSNTLTINGGGMAVDSGAAGMHVISSAVALGADQRWTNDSAAALTVNGVISGAHSLTKAGGQTLILGGVNTHSGPTKIEDGILKISSDGNLGAVPGVAAENIILESWGTLLLTNSLTIDPKRSMSVNTGGHLSMASGFTLTYGGAISGSGQLNITGGGRVDLSGASDLTGPVEIQSGSVSIGADNNLGAAPGAVVDYQLGFNNNDWNNLFFTNTFTMSSNRGVYLQRNANFHVSDGKTLTYNGIIKEDATKRYLAMNGLGTLVLGGAHEFSGTLYINQGTVVLKNADPLDADYVDFGPTSGSDWTALLLGDGTILDNDVHLREGSSGTSYFGSLEAGTASFMNAIQLSKDAFVTNVAGNTLMVRHVWQEHDATVLLKKGEGTLVLWSNDVSRITNECGTIRLGVDGWHDWNYLHLLSGSTWDLDGFAGTIGCLEGVGNVTLGGGSLHVVGGWNGTLTGVVSEAGSFYKTGSDNYTLAGSNTFDGKVYITGGCLSILQDSNLGAAPGGAEADRISIGDWAILRANTSFTLDARRGITIISGDGGILEVAASQTLQYNGIIAGAGKSLTKSGTGTLALGGNNTLSEFIYIDSGTLVLNGTNACSVNVNAGALLMGTGQMNALTVNSTATARPGASATSIGRLNVSSLTLNNGSGLRVKIGDFSDTSDRDYIENTGGAPTINATATIYVDSAALSNWDNTQTKSWNIITGNVGSTAGFALDQTTYWNDGAYSKNGGSFSLSASGGNLVLTYSAPAPDISVLGTNLAVIADGETLTQLSDGTDFGDVAVSGGTKIHTFTITNTGNASLTLENVAIGGAHPSDFTVASAGSAAPNMVINPGFETNGAGWSQTGGPTENGYEAYAAESGSFGAWMTNNAGDFYINQTVLAATWNPSYGTTFVFRVRAKKTGTITGTVNLEIYHPWQGLFSSNITALLTDSWQTFEFYYNPAGNPAENLDLRLRNAGGGSSIGQVFYDNAYFGVTNLSPGFAPVAPGGTATFDVTFDPSAAGTRTATVYITNNVTGKSPYDFVLQGNGTAPGLFISPTNMVVTALQGINPAPFTFGVTNVGGGVMSFTVATNVDWLTVSPVSGSLGALTGSQHTVTIDVAGLSLGTSTGVITVTAADATNSPQTLLVSLTINPVPVVRFEGFEGTTNDSWSYIATPGAGFIRPSKDSKNQTGNYNLRLNGSVDGASDPYVIFDNVDLSGYSNVSLSVGFACTGPDNGDDLYIDLSYDNGATWPSTTKLVDGYSGLNVNFGGTDATYTVSPNPYTIAIDNANHQVRVRFRFDEVANGYLDYYYIDNLTVVGQGSMPTVFFGTNEQTVLESGGAISIPVRISLSASATVQVCMAGSAV
ncbi:MAG: autotransporter-associated beta strand repeat-containing protein, partial [Lentisphaerota bacterium]